MSLGERLRGATHRVTVQRVRESRSDLNAALPAVAGRTSIYTATPDCVKTGPGQDKIDKSPGATYIGRAHGSVSMRSPDRLKRYRSLFKWVFLLSLPLLVAIHAPMLPSEALPHRAYHVAQSALGRSFSVLVHVGMLTPAISLVGLVVTIAIAWRK